MRRLLVLLLVFAGWLAAQAPAIEGLDEIVAQLAKITGLAPLKKVDHDVIDRAGLRKYLEERIKEETEPEEIRLEELVLKRFGLAPREFDLKQATVDLLTEQAAAFYDFKRKKLYTLTKDAVKLPVPGEMAQDAERMIIVHELAHALADQHFNLEKYIKRGRSDDASLARMAVMEGQATWLMMEVLAQKAGQSLRDAPFMIELMGAATRQSMLSQYPVLAKSPLYLQQSLMFPYTGGLKFQQAVIEKSGNAGFSQVFKNPPVTTQQVKHPEKYFSNTVSTEIRLPEPAMPGDWKRLIEGTVGEFDHSVLLEQYLSKKDADTLAPSWRGGHLALLENKKSKHVVLVYTSEWESPAAAKRMFDAYRTVLRGKWKSFAVTADAPGAVSGKGDEGLFRLALEGTRVVSIEGMRTATEFGAGSPKK